MTTILVIEDEKLAWEGLKDDLEDRGFEVDIAEDFNDARARLSSRNYTAVVVDLMIPLGNQTCTDGRSGSPAWENGLAIMDAIRSGVFPCDGVRQDVPIFVISAVSSDDAVDIQLGKLEPTEVFTKPMSTDTIAETIKLCLTEPS